MDDNYNDKSYDQYEMDNDCNDCNDCDDCNDCVDGYYGATQKFKNYEELLLLTQQEDTKDRLKNIVFALIKAVIILKCKEVSFKFDFKFASYDKWVDISSYFNINHVGKDYKILIDENTIVCILLNEKLIK